jgi:NADH:ubiquinone reductase (H+-translocating)
LLGSLSGKSIGKALYKARAADRSGEASMEAPNLVEAPKVHPVESKERTREGEQALHDIVIVGGGAGGLELATRLGKTFGKRNRARIALVEKLRTHLWKPLLHAIAAGSMDPSEEELNYLAQAHWRNFNYRFGEMTGLDRAAKEVHLAATHDEEGREITPVRSVRYDTLVMAVGSITNDFGTKGVAQYAIPLETAEQAVRFNRRLVNACIRAQTQTGPIRPGQLHVAIIGAGATGTELAAELHRTAREVVAHGLDRIDPDRDIKIVLLEAAPRILPALPDNVSDAARQLLKEIGVDVRTAAPVSEVTADGVRLASGEFVPAQLVVWSAGVKAPDFLKTLGLETNKINQLVVKETLQTTLDPDIFAIGDCADCPRPGFPGPVPPRAQAAHQQASHLARQMRLRLDGKPLQPFKYKDFGSLVSFGNYSTVGSLMGFLVGRSLFVEGYFARIMYRSLHLMHEVALYGAGRASLRALARKLSKPSEPAVKLH